MSRKDVPFSYNKLPSPLKWYGGKRYMAEKIIAEMPPHKHYCEPFAGGLGVLLAKDPEGVSEVVNDLHQDLVNFWSVLRDQTKFGQLQRKLEATPMSELLWDQCNEFYHGDTVQYYDSVYRAWSFFVWCRQSMSGRMDSFTPATRTRTRRGMNEQASSWLSAIDGLPEIHDRLRRVMIFNREATKFIQDQDGPDTLFYCDPPYVPSTRSATGVYRQEMTAEQHVELVGLLKQAKGRVILSGYPHPIYDSQLAGGWRRVEHELPNHASTAKTKHRETEVLWMNF